MGALEIRVSVQAVGFVCLEFEYILKSKYARLF